MKLQFYNLRHNFHSLIFPRKCLNFNLQIFAKESRAYKTKPFSRLESRLSYLVFKCTSYLTKISN